VTRADAADLGKQLVRLLDDASFRQRLGNRAREHAKQYDWARVGLEFVRIYRKVVATSGGQRVAA
jgi:glycosyltransferase involved in cell wall biosynthesis